MTDGRRPQRAGTIPVSASNDLGIGALGVGQVKKANHLGNGGATCAVGEEVVAKAGGIGAADALHPDAVAPKLPL